VLDPRVTLVLLVVYSCVVKGQIYIFVRYHEASPKFWSYFVSKILHDFIILNTVV